MTPNSDHIKQPLSQGIQRPARYLLRFDDLCPTMAREAWQWFAPVLRNYGIRPILAVVPDNRDPELALTPPDANFWEEMRECQSSGATIALHGYQHRCVQQGGGLVPLNRNSEFAGAPEEAQRRWIQSGAAILRAEGLDPVVWVAPRHGFDRTTLRVLRSEHIRVVSDGFARRAFTREGMTWIPQQLWGPVAQQDGLWTICLHPWNITQAAAHQIEAFLRLHATQFTSVQEVLTAPPPLPLNRMEKIQSRAALMRIQLRQLRKTWWTQR